MIKSIRGRLQWWYGAVYALSIIVFGSMVYWRADRDVHERAMLQAVSTAEYLDVSLRSIRPDAMGRPGTPADGGPGASRPFQDFPPEFRLGPLPPEFQFRPPRDRNPVHRPPTDENGRPIPGPPERDEALGGRLPDGDNPRPPRGDGFDRGPEGPRGPNGPNDNRIDVMQPPGTEDSDEDRNRPPLDRMEFAVWRADGSVLTQSGGFPSNPTFFPQSSDIPGPAPIVNKVAGGVEVLKRGPMGAMIQVVRPIHHDMANLYRFGFQIAAMATVTLAVGLFGGWWISGRIVKPIAMISETAASISAKSLNQRIDSSLLDQELVQLSSVLNSTFSRLEQSFGRLTQFTADASHELRTPLTVIQSQIELALSQPRTSENYQQTLQVCLQSAERMRSLIDGLLLLARTDSERLELRPAQTDLRNVAEEAVAQLNEKAAAAGIDLECHTPEAATMVMGDPRFLLQVPANLIVNAIQHTASGGKISVQVRLDGNDAVLTVKDTGCGIAAEHIPHLFERFYRVDTGRSRKHGGSGLGLAICKSLAEAHHGSITCDSVIDAGSAFTFRLPAAANVPAKFNSENQDA
jgi:two-component system OmpR family sensor kinase